ncbi:MAG: RidA family protein [Terracidiphilus sp.]
MNHQPKYLGRLGAELDTKTRFDAARTAALSAPAATRQYLGALDRVRQVVRLGIFIATHGNFFDQPAVADGASDLFRDVFGAENLAVKLIIAVASLPLEVPIGLEVILEVDE